jgi:hypothetical protein
MIQVGEAQISVIFAGIKANLPDPISMEVSDLYIRQHITNLIRTGKLIDFPQDSTADFRDYVVDRQAPTEDRPWFLFIVRPQTRYA